jgi:ABC-type glutathione transport system ATPase component
MKDIAEEYVPFEGGLSTWMRVLELIIAAFFLLLPLATFIWFRPVRISTFQGHADAQADVVALLAQQEREQIVDQTTQNDEVLPFIKFAFVMASKNKERQRAGEDIVLSSDGFDIGHSRMTAVVGPSGSGKSTLMKLLCGFPQPHMKLEFELQSPQYPLFYIPQSTDIWSSFLKVRDLILFTCKMNGCPFDDYLRRSAQCLQLVDLMDQTFSSLSGGQQQRVHILAGVGDSESSFCSPY